MTRYRHESGLDISDNEAFNLNDIKYPRNWISCASADEIKAIGLEAYEPDPGPAPEPTDPLTLPVGRKALRLALLGLGVTSADVVTAINEIADPIEREAALIDWEDTADYHFNHPLISAILPKIGLTIEQAETTWIKMLEEADAR